MDQDRHRVSRDTLIERDDSIRRDAAINTHFYQKKTEAFFFLIFSSFSFFFFFFLSEYSFSPPRPLLSFIFYQSFSILIIPFFIFIFNLKRINMIVFLFFYIKKTKKVFSKFLKRETSRI